LRDKRKKRRDIKMARAMKLKLNPPKRESAGKFAISIMGMTNVKKILTPPL
jgi:hypothetical protein